MGGFTGSIFHKSIEYVTQLRASYSYLIFLLPVGALIITGIYQIFRNKGCIDTNRVLEAVKSNENVPLVIAPLIFVSTLITHLLGGSAGREGAALQLGGAIGYNIGKVIKLNSDDMHIIVMSGMSSVFSALFGTPVAAAFFALEVTHIGTIRYYGIVPCVIASTVAYRTSAHFLTEAVRFNGIIFPQISLVLFMKIVVLAILCAIVSILFCSAIKGSERIMKKLFKNSYLRAFAGGSIILILTLILNTYDYNGAGMNVIERAMQGEVRWEAFLLKIIFTAITISAGFKGGEIVPSFFIGATFGCAVSSLLGIDASLGAAIGFIAVFCGVVNCPVTSLLLACEVFGSSGILTFALSCGITYMMSGRFGLYSSQEFAYSKLGETVIENKGEPL